MARLSPREEAKLRRYEALLELEPNALVFAPLASLYAREFDFQKAVAVLRRGLEIYPNYFSAHVLLARCHIALDDFTAAREELEKVLQADPYNISALGLLSDELRNRGRLAEARDSYLKILEIEPDNEEFAYKLELLTTLTEGGPFAEREDAAEAPAEPAAEPRPAPPAVPRPPEVAPPAEADALDLTGLTVAEGEEAGPEETDAGGDLATLTLAKIYEDQGLFVRARDIIEKILAREPGNAEAQAAREHLDGVLSSEESPSGASVIQLIHKVEAVSGLLEHDELEVWEEVSAGVAEALSGFEEMTLAQAVAAATGLSSFDNFVLRGEKAASWELEIGAVDAARGVDGAEELDLELPLFSGLDLPSGVNVAELTVSVAPGADGTDEFEVAARGPGAGRGGDFSFDLKARLAGTAKESPPPETKAAPAEERRRDEFGVKPERYQPRQPLELDREPFKGDDDFLGWLDSIRLKEL